MVKKLRTAWRVCTVHFCVLMRSLSSIRGQTDQSVGTDTTHRRLFQRFDFTDVCSCRIFASDRKSVFLPLWNFNSNLSVQKRQEKTIQGTTVGGKRLMRWRRKESKETNSEDLKKCLLAVIECFYLTTGKADLIFTSHVLYFGPRYIVLTHQMDPFFNVFYGTSFLVSSLSCHHNSKKADKQILKPTGFVGGWQYPKI